MNRCPITYDSLPDGVHYSPQGLRQLHRDLKSLAPLEFTAEQQRQEAIRRMRISEGRFEIVDRGGRYILKPPSLDFPELPANEDVTMRMAAAVDIEVPLHGLLRSADPSLTYFIRRFDRAGRERLPVEDFAQLSGASRDTKYDSSMEKVADIVDRFCTFPSIERVKLFERTLFSFLVGNEDMHLKNFSLITRQRKVELAPAYDFLNTTIALVNPREELALPLNGKKSKLTRKDIVDYFGRERLRLNDVILNETLARFSQALPRWHERLGHSFLSEDARGRFAELLTQRTRRMQL